MTNENNNRVQEKIWDILEPPSQETLEALSSYPNLLQRLMINRKITDTQRAEHYLYAFGSLYDPQLLEDMDITVERLWKAINKQEAIVVYGDYDVDGLTATALLTQVLMALGGKARGHIPNRFDEGYGLNIDTLDTLAEEGTRLVVTVDCGIRSPREVEHAQALNMDIIITDHHEPHGELPHATAVINPKRFGSKYPERNLAGVGVAYKIAEALLMDYQKDGIKAENWLDLVAVGTVADMVPLLDENRSLVRAGLDRLRMGTHRGLRSLAGVGGRENTDLIKAIDIGFVLGPRLNAAGRLDSAQDAFDLLMTKDDHEAAILAQKLDDQNRKRQEQTRELEEMAETQIFDAPGEEHFLLFATAPDFNKGIVGLAAAHLTQKYYRPAVIGQTDEEFTRASCRSIPEFHITQALDECADLLVRHGGHALAAGFTVANHNVLSLKERLREIAANQLHTLNLQPRLMADLELPLDKQKPNHIQLILKTLEEIEPTGIDNPEAIFVSRGLEVRHARTVGSENKHLKLVIGSGNADNVSYEAIAFNQGHWKEQMPEKVDLMYTIEINHYRDTTSVQLNVKDIKPASSE